MALAAQAQLEKVRSETAKAVGQQALDRQKMEQENLFKHQQLHAKTAIDLGRLDIEGRKAGVDHATKMGALASQLMKDQSDSDSADQDQQIKMAQAQNQSDQVAQQGQQNDNDAMLKAQQAQNQHTQAMADIASRHTQAMTQMAAQHHAAMSGVGAKHAQVIAGALAGDADRLHEAHQAALDRDSAERTTAATLGNQQTLARMKPKPK
jgi:hypothetical protein